MSFSPFSASERANLIENLAVILSSGTPLDAALDSVADQTRSKRLKRKLERLRDDVASGTPLWQAFRSNRLLPEHLVSVVRIGERSGRLKAHLRLAADQSEKERFFRLQIRTAMFYPVFVLVLTVMVGAGIAWFVLPRLAVVFSGLQVELPAITVALISIGEFLAERGPVVVPAALGAGFVAVYLLFVFPRTRVVGQAALFAVPPIRTFVTEIELARFGNLMSTFLEADVPLLEALDALGSFSSMRPYRKFYAHLGECVAAGESFRKSFASYPRAERLVPLSVQHMIVHAENSGRLKETFATVGANFEKRIEQTSKRLAVLLEPVLLVVVWIGVAALSIAVLLPIYGLISGLR